MKTSNSKRQFLKLGLLSAGTFGMLGCEGVSNTSQQLGESESQKRGNTEARPKALPFGVDIDKWKAGKGKDYELGSQQMPGVCLLPGPNAKTDWPSKDKYAGTEKVPGMCQLCSTVCGIIGYVKDGRVLKVEGNPNDPNSRGRLCARGQASLNHLYHPERLLFPMKRVGERGEGKWKRISWDEALTEIADKLRAIRELSLIHI